MPSYETLRYEVADGILTLWLSRPEQLNAFTVTMADELVAAFDRASADDEVGAIVVTGEGRAFCAGMDLSSEGNVFGLDETQRPTLADVTDRFDDPAIVDGRARHRRPRLAGDLPLHQAGHRRDQRSRRRHRRHDDAAHGRAHRVGEGADRLRVRPARHRARGLLDVVPAAHRRHQQGARARLLGGHPRRAGRRSTPGSCARSSRPTSCSRRPTRSPAPSSTVAHGWPPPSCGR